MVTKILAKFLLKNLDTMQPSYSSTAFVFGFLVINTKLLLSGLTIMSYKMSDVSISDWAIGVTALSALYVSNKHVNNIQINKENIKQEKE